MKRTTYLIRIMAFCLLALVACSKESLVQDIPQTNVPVGFSSDMPATKAVKEYTTTDDLSDMGVFTYFTHGEFDVATATPNFMYNQKVEKNIRENIDYPWTYSPIKFWPGNNTDRLSFFAYAPYVDETTSDSGNPLLSGKTAVGFPTLTYTVPFAEADQTDLLAAVPQMNRTYSDHGGTVTFPLKHALTKVAIYIKSNDDIAGKKVTSFSITSTTSGTLTFHIPANDNDNGFGWSFPENTQTISPTNGSLSVPDNATANKVLLATFFLLPNAGSTFNISYTYPGSTTGESQSISLTNKPLPSTNSWVPGAFISYTIGIEKKKIAVMAAEHFEWTEGSSATVIGGISFEDISSSDIPDWVLGGEGSVDGEEKI